MKIEVYFGDFKPAQVVQQDVVHLMKDSFERYRKFIRSVNLVVTDANGPKGGVDKQCRCVIHLKQMTPVVIQDRDASYVSLINRVAARAEQTLSQRISRKQSSYRTRSRRLLAKLGQPAVVEASSFA